ncbi:MAG: ATP synthase F1 subunit delta [Flavobacterium sp.]|nr:ATP synthase F1 subunit delta [Candidatus Neoflavobacterium equi]
MARASIRYAQAILDIANAKNNASEISKDMETIATAVKDSSELAEFLDSPVIKAEVKLSALSEIFASVHADTKSLFRLLLENKRFQILPEITEKYKELYDEARGIQVATVTTATALTPELEGKVLAKIKEISTKNISIVNVIDPSIIGGFVLRIGDQQYNASVASRLQQLKREFNN